MSVIEVAAIQGFLMYIINAISVRTTVSVHIRVSVRKRAGVHYSVVSVGRSFTVRSVQQSMNMEDGGTIDSSKILPLYTYIDNSFFGFPFPPDAIVEG